MPEADGADQRYEYKAEIKKLLDILVHSVYSSKDVFIRELISNAADALEKVRFSEVRGEELVPSDHELGIAIEFEESDDASWFIIRDNGIGMSAEEVRENLGTIAHSGAASFLENLESGQGDLSLIGQFGIGFYSVFMVADQVRLTTRSAHPGGESVEWESDGLGSYTMRTPTEELPRGTRIALRLKKDEKRFSEQQTVERAIHTYSNFVPFPISVGGERKNRTKALWREPAHQVKKEEYQDFFQFIAHETEEPLGTLHYSTDSPLQFHALLFVPNHNPEAMGFGEGEVSLQLYVKRVLIDGANPNLLPRYLRFVKGVVESEDIPLNISRETLQENRVIQKIRETLTRQLLDQLLELGRKEPERYRKLWETFGRILKEGYMDFAHREKFADLLRFPDSRGNDWTSLEEYVERMPGSQKAIYYLSGASREALDRDPRLEIFRKRGVEVLYLVEMADEVVLGSLDRYGDKELISADQVSVSDLDELGDSSGEDDAAETDEDRDSISALTERFREILGERVSEVRASRRLVDSPACLVSPEGTSAHMDRLVRLMNKESEVPVRILELNARHPLVKDLAALHASNAEDPFLGRACEQIYEGALLVDGYLTDPHRLVERMNEVLAEAASLKRH